MRMLFMILFIFISQYCFSQLIQPPFYGLSQQSAFPSEPVGGNAICNGTVVTKVVPIISITGRIWMDRNLGGSRAATSATDYQAYGCLYQWGRGNDGHASMTHTSETIGSAVNSTTSTLSTTDTPGNALFIMATEWRSPKNDLLWGVNGVNNPCPAGYRLPTSTEFINEFTSYNFTDSATAFASIHKFVLGGYRINRDGALGNTGSTAIYWTSTTAGVYSRSMVIENSSAVASSGSERGHGFSVRCIFRD